MCVCVCASGLGIYPYARNREIDGCVCVCHWYLVGIYGNGLDAVVDPRQGTTLMLLEVVWLENGLVGVEKSAF